MIVGYRRTEGGVRFSLFPRFSLVFIVFIVADLEIRRLMYGGTMAEYMASNLVAHPRETPFARPAK